MADNASADNPAHDRIPHEISGTHTTATTPTDIAANVAEANLIQSELSEIVASLQRRAEDIPDELQALLNVSPQEMARNPMAMANLKARAHSAKQIAEKQLEEEEQELLGEIAEDAEERQEELECIQEHEKVEEQKSEGGGFWETIVKRATAANEANKIKETSINDPVPSEFEIPTERQPAQYASASEPSNPFGIPALDSVLQNERQLASNIGIGNMKPASQGQLFDSLDNGVRGVAGGLEQDGGVTLT